MKNIKLPSNNLGLFFQNIAEKNKDSLALEFPSGEVITYRKLNKLEV